jgi:hypothetical protein
VIGLMLLVATALGGPPRRIPGPRPEPLPEAPVGAATEDPGAIPPPPVGSPPPAAVPDRWRLIKAVGVHERIWDPYHQNTWKGDRPIGGLWFVNLSLIGDAQARGLVAGGLPHRAGFTGSVGVDVTRGDTAFRPPVLRAKVVGRVRADTAGGDVFGLRVAHVDVLLWSVSPAWDHDAVRVGLQPFTVGPRALVLLDAQPGLRLFGTRAANRLQYGVGVYRRLDRAWSDGVVDWSDARRPDDVGVVSASVRDLVGRGNDVFVGVVAHRVRGPSPRRDVVWAGLGFDGRVGRFGLASEAWMLRGAAAATAGDPVAPVRAAAALVAPSYDVDAWRFRAQLLAASGDRDPNDGAFTGFDALREGTSAGGAPGAWRAGVVASPGAPTSGGWIPGDRTSNLPDLATPGIVAMGVGADVATSAAVRWSGDVTALSLASPRSGASFLGVDAAVGAVVRPAFNEHTRFAGDVGVLFPGAAVAALTSDRHGPLLTATLRAVLQW